MLEIVQLYRSSVLAYKRFRNSSWKTLLFHFSIMKETVVSSKFWNCRVQICSCFCDNVCILIQLRQSRDEIGSSKANFEPRLKPRSASSKKGLWKGSSHAKAIKKLIIAQIFSRLASYHFSFRFESSYQQHKNCCRVQLSGMSRSAPLGLYDMIVCWWLI